MLEFVFSIFARKKNKQKKMIKTKITELMNSSSSIFKKLPFFSISSTPANPQTNKLVSPTPASAPLTNPPPQNPQNPKQDDKKTTKKKSSWKDWIPLYVLTGGAVVVLLWRRKRNNIYWEKKREHYNRVNLGYKDEHEKRFLETLDLAIRDDQEDIIVLNVEYTMPGSEEKKNGKLEIGLYGDLVPNLAQKFKNSLIQSKKSDFVPKLARFVPHFLIQFQNPVQTPSADPNTDLVLMEEMLRLSEITNFQFSVGLIPRTSNLDHLIDPKKSANLPAGFDFDNFSWFINLFHNENLNAKYPVIGKVLNGSEFLKNLQQEATDKGTKPSDFKITKVSVQKATK